MKDLGWILEYPEIQQQDRKFGDQQTQAPSGTQDSKDLSQSQLSDSQNNSIYLRYLATKPFEMF